MNRRPSSPAELYALVERTPATVLLEFAGVSGDTQARLFTEPIRILTANTEDELARLFAEIERAAGSGMFAAGYFSYECGRCFEPTVAKGPRGDASMPAGPLAWFGIYDKAQIVDGSDGSGRATISTAPEEGERAAARLECCLGLSEAEYAARIDRIHAWIRAGDVYQLNFTVPIEVRGAAGAGALYQALRARQPAPYLAFLHIEPGRQVLSLSPELFFRVDSDGENRRITTRPMKGTAGRGRTTAEDIARSEWLAKDTKNRAENVMIVDLLRNDLGRICQFGSVTASDLFALERYRTLWQMTSTVTGRLRDEVGFQQIFRALFPCGSIMGAPKVRAMQLIGELEGRSRGVYTGAIGFFSKEETVFNVAIRTVALDGETGVMGVGSGIVIDSEAAAEWAECQLKAAFLTESGTQPRFSLVETLLWDGEFPLLELHLDRLEDSAAYFGIRFKREGVRGALEAHAGDLTGAACKVRLLLDEDGGISIGSEAISAATGGVLRVRVSAERTDSRDPFYFHKTTHRPLYARELKAAVAEGFDEVLFLNERGELGEGCVHNVFVEKDGRLLTPPIGCGVLPGVQRRHILATRANGAEQVLTLDDLRQADQVFVCNAVRGMRKAEIEWDRP